MRADLRSIHSASVSSLSRTIWPVSSTRRPSTELSARYLPSWLDTSAEWSRKTRALRISMMVPV
jgi:hypothetical protein